MVFQSENEFQAFFIRRFGSVYFDRGGKIYVKITKIAGEIIRPEIDLLEIASSQAIQVLQGFKFKVLKSQIKGYNYNRISAGIGQALSYFTYGVDYSYLILGISEDIEPISKDMVHKMIGKIGGIINELNIHRFQMVVYREFYNEITKFPPLSPTGGFVRSEIPREFLEEMESTRANLCALRFPTRKSNNFFRKYGLTQYRS